MAAWTDWSSEGLLDLLHPVRFDDGIGVDPAKDITGGVVKAKVPGGDQSLVAVLAQQDDGAFRVLQLHLLHDGRGAVCGEVVHHDDFVGRD